MAPISGRPRITSWKSEDLIKTNKDLPLAPKSNPSLDLACSVSVVESFGTVFALLLDCEGFLDCFGHQHECRRELHTVDGIRPHKEDLSARKRKLKRRAGPGPQLSSQISLSLNMKTNYGMKSQILDEKSVSYFAIFRGYCQPLWISEEELAHAWSISKSTAVAFYRFILKLKHWRNCWQTLLRLTGWQIRNAWIDFCSRKAKIWCKFLIMIMKQSLKLGIYCWESRDSRIVGSVDCNLQRQENQPVHGAKQRWPRCVLVFAKHNVE